MNTKTFTINKHVELMSIIFFFFFFLNKVALGNVTSSYLLIKNCSCYLNQYCGQIVASIRVTNLLQQRLRTKMYHFSNESKTCFPLKQMTGKRFLTKKGSSTQGNKNVQDIIAFAYIYASLQKQFFEMSPSSGTDC